MKTLEAVKEATRIEHTERRRHPVPFWFAYLVLGAAATAAYAFLPAGLQGYGYQLFAPFGAVGVIVGARRHKTGPAPVLLASGIGVSWFADLTFMGYSRLIGEVPYPSVADALYIVSYGLYIAAFVMLLRGRRSGRDFGGAIDVAIALTAFSLVEFVLVIQPNLWDASQPLLSRAVSTAYPVADILILGCLAKLLVSPGARTMSFRILAFAFLLMLGADSVYGILMQQGLYDGGLIDLFWLAAYVLYGVAMLHPSVETLAQPAPDIERTLTRGRIGVLAALALVAPVMCATMSWTMLPVPAALAIAAGAALLFLLVIARVVGLVRALDGAMSDLIAAQEARQRLLRQTLQGSEDDRLRMAAELHDGPMQQLVALSYRLDAATRSAGESAAGALGTVRDGLSAQVAELRSMMTTLRPGALEERGLGGALQDHAKRVAAEAGVECVLGLHLTTRPSRHAEVVLYRVAQEAISNIVRHASARTMTIALTESDDEVVMEVSDDGVGFDTDADDAQRFGLLSMRERVSMVDGELTITSVPLRGTTLTARIPTEVA